MGLGSSLMYRTVLYMVGCLAASLTSTGRMPVAPSSPVVTIKTISRDCQMSPGRQDHAFLRTAVLKEEEGRRDGKAAPKRRLGMSDQEILT